MNTLLLSRIHHRLSYSNNQFVNMISSLREKHIPVVLLSIPVVTFVKYCSDGRLTHDKPQTTLAHH